MRFLLAFVCLAPMLVAVAVGCDDLDAELLREQGLPPAEFECLLIPDGSGIVCGPPGDVRF